MKNVIKYLCAVLMIICTSASAWGAGIYLEYNSTKYYNGSTITIDLSPHTLPAHGSTSMAVKNDAGWTQDGTSRYGIVTTTLSGTSVPTNVSFLSGSYSASNGTPWGNDNETSYYTYSNASNWNASFQLGYYFTAAGTYNVTFTITEKDQNDGVTVLQSATITVRYRVTFSGYTITYHLTGVEAMDGNNPIATDGTGFYAYFNYASNYEGPLTYAHFTDGFYDESIGNGSGTCYYEGSASSDFQVRYNTTADGDIDIYLTATAKACAVPTVSNGGMYFSYNNAGSFRIYRGYVSDKGSNAITEYGWVINTTGNPTTSDSKLRWTSDININTYFGYGDKTGTSGTTYYVRPYATNSCGTGYGDQKAVTLPYFITLDKNGGTADGGAYVIPAGTSFVSSYTTAPTRAGWVLEGYYTSSDCVTKIANASGTLLANVTVSSTPWTNSSGQWVKGSAATFYAHWTNSSTISLDGNGATTAGSPNSVTATYNSSTLSASITNPEKTGCTFAGWNTKADGTGYTVINTSGNLVASQSGYTDGSANWIYTSNVTLYAKWTKNRFNMAVATVGNVVITATDEEGDTEVAEGANRDVLYGNMVALSHGAVSDGKQWGGWKVTRNSDSEDVTGDVITLIDETEYIEMPAYAITVSANLYTDYVFSCASLTLTKPDAGDLVFITSTAGKTVRSQERFHVEGSGLTPGATVTFSFGNSALNALFEFKKADGSAPTVSNPGGSIDEDIYVFYTPTGTSDGLDEATNLTATVAGAKPKTAMLNTKRILGRHLPADFVIAAKKDGKWWAMPSDMASTTNPTPVEIAVNDATNPSIAYTVSRTYYGLAGPTAANISGGNGQYIRFAMSIDDGTLDPHAAPLFGIATGKTTLGKSGNSQITSDLSEGNWWKLVQTNTSITNPQDAKYTIYCANNTQSLTLEDGGKWGLYTTNGTDVDELRLIPASTVVPTEAYFVEWAQHGGVIEVDATGIDATSVVAHLNGAPSSAITLVQTQTSGKNRASIYNYTVNFGDGIDFADAASNGAMLTLEWKNGATTKAVSNIIVPKIVASNITINKTNYALKSYWNTEVHVLPGKTVTVDPSAYDGSNVTIKELNIYPGATVVASTGTLIATNLILRNGWSRAGEKTYDVARLYVTPSTATLKATNVYADWYIDYDQYYPVAVPWNATVANFTYRYCTVAPTVGPTANIRLRYYDGASRAENIQEGVGDGVNWKEYGAAGNTAVPTTLTPSTGYVMTAKRPSGKAFSIIRMPLTLPSGTWGDGTWTTNGESGAVSETHKDQIAVTAYGVAEGSQTAYAEGWNLIANPYMAIYKGTIEYADETKVQYVNIPDVDFKEYNQLPTATTKLAPASAFLIQAPKTGTITFGTANRKASAPSFLTEAEPVVPEQQAYIVLNNETAEDMMGILVSDKYTAEYEINADLEKLLSDGTSLRTYMRYNDMNMAYLAINKVLAQEWIPVSVRLPEAGEYTFSLHEASIAGELEGVYLIDYQNEDKITNLIEESYNFVSEAGTINGRFAINAIIGEREIPTDIDVVGADKNSDKPIKFIYRDKVYIYHRGVIYDATGKKVKEINK